MFRFFRKRLVIDALDTHHLCLMKLVLPKAHISLEWTITAPIRVFIIARLLRNTFLAIGWLIFFRFLCCQYKKIIAELVDVALLLADRQVEVRARSHVPKPRLEALAIFVAGLQFFRLEHIPFLLVFDSDRGLFTKVPDRTILVEAQGVLRGANYKNRLHVLRISELNRRRCAQVV